VVSSFRRILFWTHLVLGLVAGVIIAIMSFTGIALAFQHELLAWADRGVSGVEVPPGNPKRLPLEAALERIAREFPDFEPTRVNIPRDPERAYIFHAGWEGPLFFDPYRGALRESEADAVQHFLWEMEEWHRWLAFPDGIDSSGRLITGVANLAFLGLCFSGLYLWFPRRWSSRAFRPLLWFVGRYRGKARDFNWHNVIGFWSLPVLVILVGTAVVISFRWGHELPFRLFGESPPESRNYGMMHVPHAEVPPPPAGAETLPYDAVIERVVQSFPDWTAIGISFPHEHEEEDAPAIHPLELGVTVPALMPSRAYVPVEADPFTGKVLQATFFDDRSPGLRTRVWIRFLHTGEAFGLTSKIIATLATAGSLVLVYTGFALSWRRFFKRRQKNAAKA
jgi:uncharacterized iron-regulated membrane protein